MRELVCGVIITDGTDVVGLVPYGKEEFLDLPKGHPEPGETDIECALRELWEETNIFLEEKDVLDLGTFPVTDYKDMHAYMYVVDDLMEFLGNQELKCQSYFMGRDGRKHPEVISITVASFDEPSFFFSMQKALKKAQIALKKL